ncbi:hypothetical protein EV361DRAFT_392868 [Lentinula raphanica]|uniref:Uncharacterized protein n=1 Tax=Lentinula raphanica TaxID=153919 RepID=A0AA38PL58_9AGAR|nr:hypothetical protein F5878DRAFT_655430 [Lentinula raphanica]KAJ3977875.1 hypothetical protein EV361DRAFT_392868 [Lentinula raphanica]
MLSSLFTKKNRQEARPKSPGENELPEITEKQTLKGPPQYLATGLHTLHDEALGELYSKPTEQTVPLEEDTSKAATSPALPHSSASPRNQEVFEVVRDPFSGQTIGALGLPDANLNPEAHVPLSDAATHNEEIWSRLSAVLELQSQIAALHLEMEGIGGKGDQGKGKGKSSREYNIHKRPPVRAASGTADLLDLDHDEGVGVGEDEDEEQRKDREREEDFARLADQFEGRKEGVNNIMLKLEELSKELTGFHALQAPNIQYPSSRTSSLSMTSPKSSVPAAKSPVSLPPAISIPTDRPSANILSPSRILDSPDSAESHEFR